MMSLEMIMMMRLQNAGAPGNVVLPKMRMLKLRPQTKKYGETVAIAKVK